MKGIVDSTALAQDVDESYDALVIGSGAGGAVVAKELAEGGMRVAIVEEGAAHTQHRDLAFDSLARLYWGGGMTGTVGVPPVPIPLGRCYGGTTLVNSGTCFRTPDAVLDRWRKDLGLEDITPERMAPIFARVEETLPVEDAGFDVMSRPNTLMHELLERAGFQGGPLRRNARNCEGCGMCCYGCSCHAKKSMDLSYLPKAIQSGADAFTRAQALEIVRDGQGRAVGVRARTVGKARRGAALMLRAPVVIVACGTLLTPILLQRNGIAKKNPHLGRHLTVHPASKVAAEFAEPIRSWAGIPQAYYYDGLHDDGIMFEGIAMPPDLGPLAVPFTGEALARYIKGYGHIATLGFMISDTAEGYMRHFFGRAHHFRYDFTKTDVARVKKGIVFLARLFLEGGARSAMAMIARPDNVFTSLDDVARFEAAPLDAADIETMAFHPLGTCRMAGKPDLGVCDAHNQVFGVPGLYVCDGSVVPTALGVNPQVTIMALATRLAEHLLGTTLGPSVPQEPQG